jgi:hypothetical protein
MGKIVQTVRIIDQNEFPVFPCLGKLCKQGVEHPGRALETLQKEQRCGGIFQKVSSHIPECSLQAAAPGTQSSMQSGPDGKKHRLSVPKVSEGFFQYLPCPGIQFPGRRIQVPGEPGKFILLREKDRAASGGKEKGRRQITGPPPRKNADGMSIQ